MQNRITAVDNLLDENGNLKHMGYASELLLNYNRKDIKANKWRIKEWDYYLISNKDFAIALTIDDNSYMGLVSASFINLKEKWEKTVSKMFWFPNGKTNLPPSSKEGITIKEGKGYSCKFTTTKEKRVLECSMDNFYNNNTYKVYFELTEEPKDSMVIATPFEKKKHFYYNQKIVGFKAVGKVEFDGKEYEFKDDTFALLDWGRGVWTYSNTWYWGAGYGMIGDELIGFNLGYGFGDTSKASENMIFVNGEHIKLEDITFDIPKNKKGKDEFLSDWKIYSKDLSFNATFTPIINRHSNTNALIIQSNQNQVFGNLNGTLNLKGKTITFKDFPCFFEKVINRW